MNCPLIPLSRPFSVKFTVVIGTGPYGMLFIILFFTLSINHFITLIRYCINKKNMV